MHTGTGAYDAEIIQRCFPNLDHYIGVDPGDYVDEVLPRLIELKPDLKVKFISDNICNICIIYVYI